MTEYHRESDQAITVGFTPKLTALAKYALPAIVVGMIAVYLVHFVTAELLAEVRTIKMDQQAHAEQSIRDSARWDVFDQQAIKSLESLVNLTRQNCVNTATTQAQRDECMRVK